MTLKDLEREVLANNPSRFYTLEALAVRRAIMRGEYVNLGSVRVTWVAGGQKYRVLIPKPTPWSFEPAWELIAEGWANKRPNVVSLAGRNSEADLKLIIMIFQALNIYTFRVLKKGGGSEVIINPGPLSPIIKIDPDGEKNGMEFGIYEVEDLT